MVKKINKKQKLIIGNAFNDKNFENIVLKTKDNYWIASRFSDCNTEYVRFGLMFANDSGEIRGHGLYHSTNVDYGSYAGIRPVCTLEKMYYLFVIKLLLKK